MNILIATVEESTKWFYYEFYVYNAKKIDPLILFVIINTIWTLFHIKYIQMQHLAMRLIITFIIGFLLYATYIEFNLTYSIIIHYLFNTIIISVLPLLLKKSVDS